MRARHCDCVEPMPRPAISSQIGDRSNSYDSQRNLYREKADVYKVDDEPNWMNKHCPRVRSELHLGTEVHRVRQDHKGKKHVEFR